MRAKAESLDSLRAAQRQGHDRLVIKGFAAQPNQDGTIQFQNSEAQDFRNYAYFFKKIQVARKASENSQLKMKLIYKILKVESKTKATTFVCEVLAASLAWPRPRPVRAGP